MSVISSHRKPPRVGDTPLVRRSLIAFVLIIPWFVGSFVSVMSMGLIMVKWGIAGGGNPVLMLLLSQLTSTGFSLAKDGFFIWLARKRVHEDLRETAARAVIPIRLAVAVSPAAAAARVNADGSGDAPGDAPPVIRGK